MNIRLERPEDYREVENLTREAFWHEMLDVYPQDCYVSDTLTALKNNYPWYANLLTKEMHLLMRMYDGADIAEVRQHWPEFMSLRNERLRLVKKLMGLDLEKFYPITETNEGVARYIEYCLYQELGIEDKTSWMLQLDSNSYYYASGFYMMLIMVKFNIGDKTEIFSKYNTLVELISDKL